MEKIKPIFLWTSKIILSLLFLLASMGKLTRDESVVKMFQDWGYFDGFYFVVGIFELVMAILLLIPGTSFYAAVALLLFMLGAMITHLLNDPLVEIIRPLVFMILLSLIIGLQWGKRPYFTDDPGSIV